MREGPPIQRLQQQSGGLTIVADSRISSGAGAGFAARGQGTVRTFDPVTKTGSALRDNGDEMTFSAVAFTASGLRFLRPGQRVHWDYDSAGQITKINIVTLD